MSSTRYVTVQFAAFVVSSTTGGKSFCKSNVLGAAQAGWSSTAQQSQTTITRVIAAGSSTGTE
jgi:hypothetical protein